MRYIQTLQFIKKAYFYESDKQTEDAYNYTNPRKSGMFSSPDPFVKTRRTKEQSQAAALRSIQQEQKRLQDPEGYERRQKQQRLNQQAQRRLKQYQAYKAQQQAKKRLQNPGRSVVKGRPWNPGDGYANRNLRHLSNNQYQRLIARNRNRSSKIVSNYRYSIPKQRWKSSYSMNRRSFK